MGKQPRIGDAVHFVPEGQKGCRAAIVTQLFTGFMEVPLTGVAVFHATGMTFEFGAQGPDPKGCAATDGGLWHWPEA